MMTQAQVSGMMNRQRSAARSADWKDSGWRKRLAGRLLVRLVLGSVGLFAFGVPGLPQPEDPGSSETTSTQGWFPELLDLDALCRETSGRVQIVRGPALGAEAPFTLLREQRPGVLVRFWLRDPDAVGELRFYIDGAATPSLAISGKKLFSGSAFPFIHPFVSCGSREAKSEGDDESRDGICIFPIPYRKSLRIEADTRIEDYAVAIRRLPRLEMPLAYDRSALDYYAGEVLNVAEALSKRSLGPGPGGEDLDNLTLPRAEGRGPAGIKPHEIEPGQERTVYRWRGPGVIRKILLRVRGNDEPLRTVSIAMYWDGWFEPCVSVPVGDFFLSGATRTEGGGMISGYREGSDVYYCRWPMPFRTGAEIRLRNEGRNPVLIDVAVETGVNDQALERNLYFHGAFAVSELAKHREDAAIDLLSYAGKGHFVGTHLTLVGSNSGSEASGESEGKELARSLARGVKVEVDGHDIASAEPEGLAESFGSDPGFLTAAACSPYYGVLAGTQGAVSAYRHRLTDRVVFREGLGVSFLPDPEDRELRQVGASIFFYGEGLLTEEEDGESRRTGFRDLESLRLAPVEARRVGLARPTTRTARARRRGIEAHLLPLVSIRGGGTGRESAILTNSGLSGDDFLFFRGREVGAYVELDLALKKGGDYRFEVWPVRGEAMGTWTLSVDGEAFEKGFDGYAKELDAPEKVVFGRRTLAAGPHRLRFTATGKSEDSKGFGVGVDLISVFPMRKSRTE